MTTSAEPIPEHDANGASNGDDGVDDTAADFHLDPYDPYENELIGQFLMALGYKACQSEKPVVHVALLQQTPDDTFYGDALFGCTSYHAIEFKRSDDVADLKKERLKWKLQDLENHVKVRVEGDHGAGHWLVFGSADRRTVNYTTYMPQMIPSLTVPRVVAQAEELIDQLINGSGGFPHAEHLHDYLKGIAVHRKKKSSRSGGAGSVNFLGVGMHATYGVVLFSAEALAHELAHRATPGAQRPLMPQPQPIRSEARKNKLKPRRRRTL